MIFPDIFIWGVVLLFILLILYLRYVIISQLVNYRIYQAQRILDKNREKAIHLLSSVLTLEKNNPLANWLMANIYFKSHHLILAKMYLNDILHYHRFIHEVNEQVVRELMADVYYRLGEFNKALTEYYILKKLNKLSLSSVKAAIRLNIENSRYADARKFLADAHAVVHESDGETDYLEAIVEFYHANFNVAEGLLHSALKKGFVTPEIDHLLGKVLFIKGKYEEAISYFQKLPSKMLESEELEDLIGQCFYHISDYSSAINTLEKLVPDLKRRKDRAMAEPVFILGCAYEASGNLSKAIETWELLETTIPYFQNASHKLYFYQKVITDKTLQDFIASPFKNFLHKSEMLVEKMDFLIKQKIYEDDRTIELLCSNQKDLHPYYSYIVIISRQTSAINPEFIMEKMNLMGAFRGKYLLIVAPMFNEEATSFAEKNLITIYDLELFRKNGLIEEAFPK